MNIRKILILCGGGGAEHDISLISAKYLESTLQSESGIIVTKMELKKNEWPMDFFNSLRGFDYVIPCIHGFPGETGDIQSWLDMLDVPYLGAGPESSKLCFNKISTKLWLASVKIPVTPFTYISSLKEVKKAHHFMKKHGKIFIKPSSQGSSVGCHLVTEISELEKALEDALLFSPYALIEKCLTARELEVSVFEYKNKIKTTVPGEVVIANCKDHFYSYKEKYDSSSQAFTVVKAQGLDAKIAKKIMNYAKLAFKTLKIRHLSRIDFFLTDQGKIYLNEINTFPGLTPISMFPKMMEADGTSFKKFLLEKING